MRDMGDTKYLWGCIREKFRLIFNNHVGYVFDTGLKIEIVVEKSITRH